MSLTNLNNITNDKTVFIYEDSLTRMQLLARYLKEGIARNELCVLLSPAEKADVINDLKLSGFNPTQVLLSGQLRFFKIGQTPLQDGYFAADFILHNAEHYDRDAKRLGYSGFRAAGEMPWMPAHLDLSFLGSRLGPSDSADYMGICFYPINSELRCHPSVVYDGNIADLPPVFAT
jgi:hypothetical protein